MSKKNKKQPKQKPAATATQSSVSFSFNKWFKKILTIHPSALIIVAIMLGYVLFLLGGGLFTITSENIIPAWSHNNKFYFLSPFGISDQFVADTVISIMLYLMGFVGLLSIYQSTKNASKPRQAYMLLIVGASLVLLSYIFLESSMYIKTLGIR
jgi:hypothetical protein